MLRIKDKSNDFFYIGQFGLNKPIVDSADLNLQSHAFRYFRDHREEYELVDHY